MINSFYLKMVGVLVSCGLLFWYGFTVGKNNQLIQQQKIEKEWQKKIDEARDQYLAELNKANEAKDKWIKYANDKSIELSEARVKLELKTKQLKSEVTHAINADKDNRINHCTFGANSLQLYKKAMGYTD